VLLTLGSPEGFLCSIYVSDCQQAITLNTASSTTREVEHTRGKNSTNNGANIPLILSRHDKQSKFERTLKGLRRNHKQTLNLVDHITTANHKVRL